MKTKKIKKQTKLKTYKVFGEYTQSFEAEVEAKNRDEAMDIAEELDYDEWEENNSYCGEPIKVVDAEEVD